MPYVYRESVRIYYEMVGEGSPLLLWHDLPDSLDLWWRAGWVERLKGAHRLILVDGRGQGRSDRPARSQAYTVGKQVGDIVAVLDELALRRVHYMGGWLGFGLARFAPGRLRSLIFLGAHPYGRTGAEARPDVSDVLATTFIPALLYAGTADAHADKVRQSAAALPRGQLRMVAGLNQGQLYRRPAATLPGIRYFIQGLEQSDRFRRRLLETTAL